MNKDIITMRLTEIDRLKIINKVLSEDITQVKAAEILAISDRHLRRIIRRIKEQGDRGIIHKSRGKPSSRRISQDEENNIARAIEKRYTGFGPTLACEKLLEHDGIKVSKEKLRQIMLARGLWQRQRRRKKIHRWRERKAYYGEMVQMDGSHHDWLEGRGPELVLMGYVDDATGRLFCRFYDHEGVYPAIDSLCSYIRLYGRPVSLYLDKHSTYKTTRDPTLDELLRGDRAATQFERACKEAGIKVIHAHSPQAKGRIERVFGTLQDRLIKEMRLESISSQKEANMFLEGFLAHYNRRFTKEALKRQNVHKRMPVGMKLRDIFCLKSQRVVTNGYTVKWKGKQLLIENPKLVRPRQKVEIREFFDGHIEIKITNKYLKFREIETEKTKKTKNVDRTMLTRKARYIPPSNHPWRRYDQTAKLRAERRSF